MKIIRFFDEQDRPCYGHSYSDGKAILLEGELFGEFTDTGRQVPVKKILAPLEPAAIFGIALCVFTATSADRLGRQSAGPHFVHLADAFLHGQLHNRLPPPNDNDWIHSGGKVYVSFPPVPAVLMTPFVAVFGIGFNDTLFTLPFAALNVLLMFLVLQMLAREGLSAMSRRDNLWLTGLFAFGTGRRDGQGKHIGYPEHGVLHDQPAAHCIRR